MAWLTSVDEENRITVSSNHYYETQSHPTDSNKIQVRKIRERTSEYRGLTISAAFAEAQNQTYSVNYTKSYQYTPIGGGGYNLIMSERWILSDWIDIENGEESGEG